MIRKEDIKKIMYLPYFELPNEYIKKNKWCSVVLNDNPQSIDFEWVSNAFNEFGDEEIYYVAWSPKYKNNLLIEYRKHTKELMIQFMDNNAWMKTLFVSSKSNGLMFQYDEYCVIAGHKEFMKIAHPISYETTKDMFFENVNVMREEALRNYTKIWDTYALKNCQ